jgi:hypothetical protein
MALSYLSKQAREHVEEAERNYRLYVRLLDDLQEPSWALVLLFYSALQPAARVASTAQSSSAAGCVDTAAGASVGGCVTRQSRHGGILRNGLQRLARGVGRCRQVGL